VGVDEGAQDVVFAGGAELEVDGCALGPEKSVVEAAFHRACLVGVLC